MAKKQCWKCGGKDVAKILYGYPISDEELEKEIDAGKIVLGGCIRMPLDFVCNSCGHRW